MKDINAIAYELLELETCLEVEEDDFKDSLSFRYCETLLEHMKDLVFKLHHCLPTCHFCRDLIPHPYDRVKVGHSNSNQIKHRFCSLDCESEWRRSR
jgi:hypothetical protein